MGKSNLGNACRGGGLQAVRKLCFKGSIVSPLANSQKWLRLGPVIGGAIDGGIMAQNVDPACGTTELDPQARHSTRPSKKCLCQITFVKEHSRNS